MFGHIAAIARVTIIEARRSRLLLLLLVGLALALGVAQFGASLALTDTDSFRAVLFASLARLLAVVVLGLFVVSSVLREFDDKLAELTLAMPVRRASFLGGKLLGYAALSAATAVVAGAVVMLLAPWQAALVWGLSLGLELLLVCSAALLLALTLNQATGAVVVLSAGYALARSIDAIRLLAANPLAEIGGVGDVLARGVIEALAFVFPALSRFTQSAWLTADALPFATLGPVAVQALLYAALLAAVALFDLHRRPL